MISTLITYATIVVLATAPAEDDAFYYATKLELESDDLAANASAEMVASDRSLIERGLLDLLGHHHIQMAAGADEAAELTVELAWANKKKTIYAVEIRCERPDGGTHSKSFEVLGDADDVLAKIEEDLPTILGWLERPSPSKASAEPPTPTVTDVSDPPERTGNPRTVGPLGWTGIALMTAGIGPLVAGAVMFPQTRTRLVQVDTGSGVETQERIEPKYPDALTGALIGVGSVFVVAGVGMLVGDQVRRKKGRARASTFAPTFSAERVGFTITRRF
jgi:hypothetical protein